MHRCEHGFITCYPCKHSGTIGTGCHYPKCDDTPSLGEKFCPKHGGKYAAHYKEGNEK